MQDFIDERMKKFLIFFKIFIDLFNRKCYNNFGYREIAKIYPSNPSPLQSMFMLWRGIFFQEA